MTRRNLTMLSLLITLFASLTPAAWAQNISATLRGTVHDGTGSVVSGATVTVQNNATGIVHTTATNASGDYVVLQLPPATYTVTVSQNGFEPSCFG